MVGFDTSTWLDLNYELDLISPKNVLWNKALRNYAMNADVAEYLECYEKMMVTCPSEIVDG